MIAIDLDKVFEHGFDTANDNILLKSKQDGRDLVLHASPEGLARLLTRLLQAAKNCGERTGKLIDLPDVVSERIAFMEPSALDVRRPPKSDGALLFQAGQLCSK